METHLCIADWTVPGFEGSLSKWSLLRSFLCVLRICVPDTSNRGWASALLRPPKLKLEGNMFIWCGSSKPLYLPHECASTYSWYTVLTDLRYALQLWHCIADWTVPGFGGSLSKWSMHSYFLCVFRIYTRAGAGARPREDNWANAYLSACTLVPLCPRTEALWAPPPRLN